MLTEQPECGAPCALCESLAHLCAKAREEVAKYRAAFKFELEHLQKLQAENAVLRARLDEEAVAAPLQLPHRGTAARGQQSTMPQVE